MARSFNCPNPEAFELSQKMRKAFKEDGYLIIKGLFTTEEINKMKQAAEDQIVADNAYDRPDGEQAKMRTSLWNHPGNDVLGMVARSRKVVATCEELLNDEVYHYHAKIMMKNPKIGGKVLWHQVMKGSHKLGRLDHAIPDGAGQQQADPERIKQIREKAGFQLDYVEQEPGDCLFFHCNLLHSSDRNESNSRRWMYAVAYNTASNNHPVYEHHHPQYTKLNKVENSSIIECSQLTDFEGRQWMDVSKNSTIRTAEEVETGEKQII